MGCTEGWFVFQDIHILFTVSVPRKLYVNFQIGIHLLWFYYLYNKLAIHPADLHMKYKTLNLGLID